MSIVLQGTGNKTTYGSDCAWHYQISPRNDWDVFWGTKNASVWTTVVDQQADKHGHFYNHIASMAKNSFISMSCKVYRHTEVLCLKFIAEIKLILYALKYRMGIYFGN